jgi:hypothetical protein
VSSIVQLLPYSSLTGRMAVADTIALGAVFAVEQWYPPDLCAVY